MKGLTRVEEERQSAGAPRRGGSAAIWHRDLAHADGLAAVEDSRLATVRHRRGARDSHPAVVETTTGSLVAPQFRESKFGARFSEVALTLSGSPRYEYLLTYGSQSFIYRGDIFRTNGPGRRGLLRVCAEVTS
jgi:hypothetical protein